MLNSLQDSLQDSLQVGCQDSLQDSLQVGLQVGCTLNKQNKTKLNKTKQKEKKVKKKSFVPPTLEEVEAYVKDRGLKTDAQKFFDYYDATGWKDAKGNQVLSWKGKIQVWENKRSDVQPSAANPQRTSNPFLKILAEEENYDETGNNSNTGSNEGFVSTILSDYTIE